MGKDAAAFLESFQRSDIMSSVNTATAPIATTVSEPTIAPTSYPQWWLNIDQTKSVPLWRKSDIAVEFFRRHGEPMPYEQYLAAKESAQGSPVIA
jgi:hypothetical protein